MGQELLYVCSRPRLQRFLVTSLLDSPVVYPHTPSSDTLPKPSVDYKKGLLKY